ncbi:hypothetical protein [Corynebacterium sp. A21]|uniref:hypothetical protein n=1 Tax=Corynebacterium sp. A21 TaxID=3457318 RepID=UPI003FD2FEAB
MSTNNPFDWNAPSQVPPQNSANPWQNPHQAPPSQQFPPQQSPPAKTATGTIIAIVLAVVLVLVLALGIAAWGLNLFGLRSSEGRAVTQVTLTEVVPAPETDAATNPAANGAGAAPQVVERPQYPGLPSGAVAANPAAQSGAAAGNFNNVYAGTSVTSQPFARAVRDVYASNFVGTGALDATLDVYSSVTGRTYTMSCRDNGAFVTCTGGNNAVVYIS